MAEPTIVYDGQASFEGGQDASLPPSRLAENRFAAGVNTSTRKGVITSRFAYERKKVMFPEGGYSYRFNKVANFKRLYESGRFQNLTPYLIGTHWHLIVVVSGVIYLIDLDMFDVRNLTLNRDTQLNENAYRINSTIAGKYVVLHDFPSRPIIVDGHSAYRSRAMYSEVPVSNLGAYNQSRLEFANFGNEWSAGDPVGNAATPDAPITVNEIELIGSPYYGDVYDMTSKHNHPITAMATLQAIDASTGVGPLIVASPNEIFAFDTSKPRDQWIAGQFCSSISDNAGITGQRAHDNVNSDIYFVSDDGQLRTLTVARDEQKGKWSRVPINREVDNWISYLSPELIKYSAVRYFKNKIFWTVRPYRIPARTLDDKRCLDVIHSGFLVLELDNIARLGTDASPAWAGLWTGIRPMDMCIAGGRMFVMAKEQYSRNVLYEVDPELRYDRTETGVRRPIKSTIYTREHTFEDLFATKDLQSVELGITDISGDFSLDIDFKPAQSAKFLYWSTFKFKATVEYTDLFSGDIPERTPVSFSELKFGCPEVEEGHPVTQDMLDKVKRVQFRFILQGNSWQLNEYRITATKPTENAVDNIKENLPDQTQKRDNYSDWQYEEFGL